MVRPPHILVVDDNVDLAENVAEALELGGATVDLACNGLEALARLESRSYDLVLTDMRMPEVSGLDLIRALRARDPGTPVIVMTAYTTGEELDEARAHGALDVLEKPVDLAKVVGLVERLRANRTVLVVEDDAALRANLIEALFALDGFIPFSACTAGEARALTERVRPRIVVLDLRLPDERGGTLLGQLLAMPDVQVIVTTGYRADAEAELADTLVLEKPFSIPVLLDRVRELA